MMNDTRTMLTDPPTVTDSRRMALIMELHRSGNMQAIAHAKKQRRVCAELTRMMRAEVTVEGLQRVITMLVQP